MKKILNSKYWWALSAFPNVLLMLCLLRIRNYTMTSPARARLLWKACSQSIRNQIPGDFVECGVWKGGSAGIMAMAAKGSLKKIHLYDSFEGLPEPSELDGTKAYDYSGGVSMGRLLSVKKCVGTLDEVKNLLEGKCKLQPSMIVYHVGWFQKTIKLLPPQSIAVLRLDGDWYESTKVCLENLYPGLSKGGFLLIDDYYCWEGCKKAVDDYRETHKITDKIVRIDKESCFWIKKSEP